MTNQKGMTPKRGERWFWLWITGLGIFIYSPVLNAFFAADDFGLLFGIDRDGALGVWSLPPNDFFRPLISLSLFLDYQVWGFNPLGFHLTNLLFHLLNSYWVCRVARVWGLEERASRWAGALFLVLTCHVEATAWIAGRTDLIATFFCLLSLDGYFRWRTSGNNRLLLMAYGALIPALMAKETAVVIPFLFIAYEWRHLAESQTAKPFMRSLLPSGMALLILTIYLFVRASVVGGLIGGYGASQHLKAELLPTLLNVAMHFFKTLLPVSLSDAASGGLYFLLISGTGLCILFILIHLFLPSNRPSPAPYSLLLAFLISVLPTATLKLPLMMGFNDRFTYFPSVWGVMLLAGGLSRVAGLARGAIAVGLILFYSTGTWQSNLHWARAGQLTQSYLFSLKRIDPTHPLLFLSVPDSYRSAYLFRNGLPEAIQLFVPGLEKQKVIILSKFSKRLDENTALEPVKGRLGEFRLTGTHDRLMPPERAPMLTVPVQYELSESRILLPPQQVLKDYRLLLPGSSGFFDITKYRQDGQDLRDKSTRPPETRNRIDRMIWNRRLWIFPFPPSIFAPALCSFCL